MKRLLLVLLLVPWVVQATELPAKDLFAAEHSPSAGAPEIFGSYAKGCLAGAMHLPSDGTDYQTMRPSRRRAFGHPLLIDWIERFAVDAHAAGWPGLLVGDLGQPRGGPLDGGHASHQIGLDVDLWLTAKPDHALTTGEREELSAVSMLRPGTRSLDPARFGQRQIALIETAAGEPDVERIFVHPAIKQALCRAAGNDRTWLTKVRPWWGHDDHIHVRLRCPAGQPDCRAQEPPPPGDGCGGELAWWLSDEPWQKPAVPPPPKPPLTLTDLPARCADVLHAP